MKCSKCEQEKTIVNKHFKLCLECNNERLHGSKYGKQISYIPKKFPSIKPKKNKGKKSLFTKSFKSKEARDSSLHKDELFYEKCFNSIGIHKCEECSAPLPDIFKQDGKIVARFRYSHIIAKSIAPHLRWVMKNINHLCLICHSKWDHGDKKQMKIYEKNKKIFPEYLE